MNPRLFRLIVCAWLGWAMATSLSCASAPVQPAVDMLQAQRTDGQGPSDVHVMAQGLILDLHMADDYIVCVELTAYYKCLPLRDLRAWLGVWRSAMTQEKALAAPTSPP